MATTIKKDRITGDKYDTWQIRIRAILIQNDWDTYQERYQDHS